MIAVFPSVFTTKLPTFGAVLKPKTSTDLLGPAISTLFWFSSNIALTLAREFSTLIFSPTFKLPFLTNTVAKKPFRLSREDSIITPLNGFFGSAFKSSISEIRRIISRSSSIPLPVLAEISTQTTLPPRPSTKTPSFFNCSLTFWEFAPGRSILLIATKNGVFATPICSRDSFVWGITPSTPAITKTTKSVTLAPRALILAKAIWPGVSIKVICLPWCSIW